MKRILGQNGYRAVVSSDDQHRPVGETSEYDYFVASNGLVLAAAAGTVPSAIPLPVAHTHSVNDITGLQLGGAEYVRTKKTADTSNASNTTWVTDPHLAFTLLPLTDYEFGFNVIFTSPVATTGLQLALTGPASPASFVANIRVPISKVAEVHVNTRTYDDPALGTGVDAINVPLLATIQGNIRTGALGGAFGVRFRSEVNSSAVVLKSGSTGRLKAV